MSDMGDLKNYVQILSKYNAVSDRLKKIEQRYVDTDPANPDKMNLKYRLGAFYESSYVPVREKMLNERLECLASLEHEQWAHWVGYMLENITPENIEGWKRQKDLSYVELSESEKESDREWARKVLKIIDMQGEKPE